MAETQGVRGHSALSSESRAVRNVWPSMYKLQPNAAPITTIMGKLNAKPADNPEFEWYEDDLVPRFDTLGGALTAGATTMTVTNYKRFRAGHLVKVAGGEIVRVSATPSSTSVTISRAFGETAAVAADSGAQLLIIGTAFADGSAKANIISTVKVNKTNYCTIHKTAGGQTGTNKHTKQHAGQDANEEKANKLLEHKQGIEGATWHSEQKKDESGSEPIWSTRGILRYIQTNVKDVGGEMTEEEFEDWIRVCFRFGSPQKLVLGSPKAMQVINSFARGKLEMRPEDQKYGVTITSYQNAGRQVKLAELPEFTNEDLNDLSGMAGYAVCLDLSDITLRYMRGMIVSFEDNIQTPGTDAREYQYLSQVGLQFAQEKKHGLLTGITS